MKNVLYFVIAVSAPLVLFTEIYQMELCKKKKLLL